jgi:preprotein translocase subunit SecD
MSKFTKNRAAKTREEKQSSALLHGEKRKRINFAILCVTFLALVTSALFIFPLNGKKSFQIGKTDYDFYWIAHAIKLGLDLEGGMYAVYSADLSDISGSGEQDNAMEGTVANLQTLLFNQGYTEASVTRQGSNKIRVEVPSVSDTEQLMSLIGDPAKLEFKDPGGNVVIRGSQDLTDAQPQLYEGTYAISLTFNNSGKEKFATATTNNVGNKISIWVNDVKIMEPTVNAAITDGKAVITGNYTYETANEMAMRLKAGTFAVLLTPEQTSTISPTLGETALSLALIAGAAGLLFIFIFMLVVYRGLGVCADLALLIYTVLTIYSLALIPWVQLTLPGIAGVVLSIGMAVDANIVVFERIREERKLGRAIQSATETGFKSGIVAIIDSNITTIIASIVLIIFGNTTVQSFAITLLIGVILSMLTAVVITHGLLKISLSFNSTSDVYYALKFREKKHKDDDDGYTDDDGVEEIGEGA